jgi:hypothetical protein
MDSEIIANDQPELISDPNMRGFQNQMPNGADTAVPDSEPGADGQALSRIRACARQGIHSETIRQEFLLAYPTQRR